MKTIYKYPIRITDQQEVALPEDAAIIRTGLDPVGTPCIWAVVDTDKPRVWTTILVVGTGNPMPPGSSCHLGSFAQGSFVWHVFLAGQKPNITP